MDTKGCETEKTMRMRKAMESEGMAVPYEAYWRDQVRFFARSLVEIFDKIQKMMAPGRRRKRMEAAKTPLVRRNVKK